MSDIVELNNFIDLTLVDARATKADLEKVCDIAYKNQYYSVCVNSCNVAYVSDYINANLLGALRVVSMIGFPLGAVKTDVKIFEIKQAIQDGADEIEVVLNIARLKENDFKYLKHELVQIKKATKKKVLRVVLETCYLSQNELVKILELCAKLKVDYVATSTGFGVAGADLDIVNFMNKVLAGRCKIKASGAIKDRMQAVNLINCGASLIGTSRVL